MEAMMWRVLIALLLPCCTLAQQAEVVYAPQRVRPLDDIVERHLMDDHRVLPYPAVHERDILWEKRIWREIDTRQKINLPFRYPPKPFISILLDEIKAGNITAYNPEDDSFSTPLCWDELQKTINQTDTVITFDPETYEETIQVVVNDFNPESVIKYRVKEVWWVDSRYSQLKVRILGIAPIMEVYDDRGELKYERPMFWIYYPNARYALARHKVFNPWNDNSPLSWEDWLEMRFFDSYVVKESNVHDRRLKDYLTGIDALLEGQKIMDEIFNYEMDLWSY